jgi:DNA polymerase-1
MAWDTETCLIRPAQLAPALVCVTWQSPGTEADIEHHSTIEPRLRAWLEDPNGVLVGHNVAYDLAVVGERFPHLLPLIFAAYDANRVTDTKLRQQLLDIASGVYRGRLGEHGRWITHEYTLEALARRCAGMQLQKDAWRLSYGEFLDTPIGQWPTRAREVQANARVKLAELEAHPHAGSSPEEKAIKKEIDGLREMVESPPEQCLRYPLDDARATLVVYLAQEKHAEYLNDQYRQARAAWALHLLSAWGLRTNPDAVERLRKTTQADLVRLEAELVQHGLVRTDGSRDTKAAKRRMVQVCRSAGLRIHRTAAHEGCEIGDECEDHVSLDSDACKAVEDEDEALSAYAELSTTKKVLSNDVEMLATGVYWPVHTRYDIAETGRAVSSKPNITNLRRQKKATRSCTEHDDCRAHPEIGLACAEEQQQGIRECFVPRPGYVFAQADYPQLELYTLAQCCVSWIGFSKLAEALNRGLDPHLAMAANILKISYEEAKANKKRSDVDNARQTAKVANFGFPGGLGIEKLILFAKKTYGVVLTPDDASALKRNWFETWPEMPRYFARINSLVDQDTGRVNCESLFTERHRGDATYCAACNSGFQGLGADCAKNAAWIISRAAYVESASPLFNARVVAFVHDEFIAEVRDDERASDAAEELARLMVKGANVYLPDVPILESKMEPLLMRRWSKKAEPKRDARGRLIAWG